MIVICRVTPHVGVWIETTNMDEVKGKAGVTPHVGVWIETIEDLPIMRFHKVTPHVGVWIETGLLHAPFTKRWSHLM